MQEVGLGRALFHSLNSVFQFSSGAGLAGAAVGPSAGLVGASLRRVMPSFEEVLRFTDLSAVMRFLEALMVDI